MWAQIARRDPPNYVQTVSRFTLTTVSERVAGRWEPDKKGRGVVKLEPLIVCGAWGEAVVAHELGHACTTPGDLAEFPRVYSCRTPLDG